ncbi:alpha-L-fucosidase [Tessaracoccus sp. MC1627]|uniref:alpha-L-fucosidase n=1 Tax=Tessaracoccus sp. MC1627 TaxID=2760312 RepID=UPI0016031869|nr:alpha-L-fucosidase [Tessaracoccus sp. MC1627]MBB1511221.1 alpha-L-fucosidase [Tessaracoccus sp. MC1627]
MTEARSFEELSERELPQWYADTPFGIFIHWGAYSVSAWGEPIGALGTIEWETWFKHNPYSEWYYNTIRIEGSPAQEHHREVYGDMPYDGLLDLWKAERFDPTDWAALFRDAGAGYVIPTTKHHDGITLWNAPDTEGRNTVARGPKRDLIAPIAEAVREAGMHFGVYYSGGLDWHVRPMPPHTTDESVNDTGRPKDAEYGAYCARQCRDLIDRYQPEVLWNDIQWPDDAKNFGPDGLGTLFNYFYAHVPTGVVNDRYGDTHSDYLTSEYSHLLTNEGDKAWENCRGIGYSFAYNQLEDESHYLTGYQIARMLTDIVSRGGHFLLNVGPKADGTLPELQRRALVDLAGWMRTGPKEVLYGSRPVAMEDVTPGEGVWVRGVVDKSGVRRLFVDLEEADPQAAAAAALTVGSENMTVELPAGRSGPVLM